MRLIEFGAQGELPTDVPINEFLSEVADEVVAHYGRIAFVPPWLCFVGLEDGIPVAVGGYKSQPVEGRVEISYGTVPGYDGKGQRRQDADQEADRRPALRVAPAAAHRPRVAALQAPHPVHRPAANLRRAAAVRHRANRPRRVVPAAVRRVPAA